MHPLDTTVQPAAADRIASSTHDMTAARATSLGCTKLRDSCHPCASSKIKCPKEKPSCSKCASRGIDCQYFFAKRPGRRRENSTGHPHSCTSNNTIVVTSSSSNSSNRPIPKPSPAPIANPSSVPIPSSVPNSSNATANPTAGNEPRSAPSRDEDTIEVWPLSPPASAAPNGTIPSAGLSGRSSFLGGATPSFTMPNSPASENILRSYSSDLFSMLGDGADMFQQLADFDPDINDMDFVMSDSYFEYPVTDGDSNGISDGTTRTPNDISSLLIPDDSVDLDLGTSDAGHLMRTSSRASSGVSSEVPSLASGVPTPSTVKSSAAPAAAAESPCGCVTRALGLLQALSSAQPLPLSKSPGTDLALSSNMASMGFSKAVVSENKQSIEAVSSMLSCPSCTQDTFLLTILSMIVLKILARYAAATQPQLYGTRAGRAKLDTVPRLANSIISSSRDHMRALSHAYSMPRDEGADGRVTAQLVLSELHRAQRLVNELSPKLRGPAEGDGRGGTELELGMRGRAAEEGGKAATTQFSSGTLAQMESDLRKSLSSLSADIINILRQN